MGFLDKFTKHMTPDGIGKGLEKGGEGLGAIVSGGVHGFRRSLINILETPAEREQRKLMN